MSLRFIVTGLLGLVVAALSTIVAVGLWADNSDTIGETSDVLLRAYANDPDTLNPITASDTTSEAFQALVYEMLAERDMANPDEWVPVLATHWEFDEDRLEYTIHLRRGVMWHPMRLPNGQWLPETELTARDVKFTFDCILNKYVEAAHMRSYYEDPDPADSANPYKIEVSVVDKYTVKVRWKKPYFHAKTYTLGMFVIPRHVFSVDENGEPIALDFSLKEFADGFNNHWASTKMCGTGPMRFSEWTRSRRLVLQRNPDYWGRPYNFQKAIYRCIPNTNTVVRKLLQNDLDIATIARPDLYFDAKDNPNVKDGRVTLLEFPYPGYRYIGYNMRKPLFQDVAVRKALSHAVPVRKIIDQVWKGLAVPIAGPFLPGSSASDDSLPPIPYDLDRSRRLLDEAGWRDSDGDGIRDKLIDGRRIIADFELMIYADAPSYQTVAEIVQENCRKIGVAVRVVPAKWALMLQKLRKREFDAAMLGWALSWESDPFQIWHSSQADLPDSSNHVSYRNAEVDRLIEKLRVTMDEEKQIPLYHRIHRFLYEDQPYTFLFQDKATAGYDSRLKNVRTYKIRPCLDSREWYVGEPPTRE